MYSAAFTRDEVILALDVLYSCDKRYPAADSQAIQDLSALLNRLPIHPKGNRRNDFRTPSGIFAQIQRFEAFYRTGQIMPTSGRISIRVMKDTLSFVHENMEGAHFLSEANCTEEMVSVLFEYALHGSSLDESILRILNVSVFCGTDVMGKWRGMSHNHKCFVALWFELHPDSTYLGHCFALSKDVTDVESLVLLEIFNVRTTRPEWVCEYQKLAAVMSLRPNAQFFDQLDNMPEYENRLDYLTVETREERVYLLRMIGKWMRQDPMQALASQKLLTVFPALHAYLEHVPALYDEGIARYLSLYKTYKLENTLPIDEDSYFSGVKTDCYDYRYAVLSECIHADTIVLWIDALGVEWLSLLLWSLKNHCDATVEKAVIVQATLPTETCYNNQWEQLQVPYDKLDKLDGLAHKGTIDEPDYYSCIEEQIAFVSGLYRHVNKLLSQHRRVIITGDHGTSRLAARLFHNKDGLPAPQGAKLFSHGRGCILPTNMPIALPHLRFVKHPDGAQFAVFENYDHFAISGYAAGADDDKPLYGEVHGGATPEEMLVPLIVLNSHHSVPLIASWEQSSVKIKMKKAALSIRFNQPVHHLSVKVGNIDGLVNANSDGTIWSVIVNNLKEGSYAPVVVANQQIVSLPNITVRPALGGGDGDLP